MTCVRAMLVAALVTIASVAQGGTLREKMEHLVKKYAPKGGSQAELLGRAKTACICLDAGSLLHKAGFVAYDDLGDFGFGTRCIVPTVFLEDGDLLSALNCSDFVPLSK